MLFFASHHFLFKLLNKYLRNFYDIISKLATKAYYYRKLFLVENLKNNAEKLPVSMKIFQ